MVVVSILLFCNKIPQALWLKAMQMYYLRVSEVRASPEGSYRAKIIVLAGVHLI